METPAYLTTVQAAEFMNISASMLSKLRMTGEGPSVIRVGRACRYRPIDLEAWMTARLCRRSNSTEAA